VPEVQTPQNEHAHLHINKQQIKRRVTKQTNKKETPSAFLTKFNARHHPVTAKSKRMDKSNIQGVDRNQLTGRGSATCVEPSYPAASAGGSTADHVRPRYGRAGWVFLKFCVPETLCSRALHILLSGVCQGRERHAVPCCRVLNTSQAPKAWSGYSKSRASSSPTSDPSVPLGEACHQARLRYFGHRSRLRPGRAPRAVPRNLVLGDRRQGRPPPSGFRFPTWTRRLAL